MSVGKFAFLPNLRSGAAAEANLQGIRARVDYELEVISGGTAQTGLIDVGATLRGPGDVVGLDPSQIRRIEPESVNKGFEPNYFPFIELRDADLPWRYSLGHGTTDQLMPWLTLIALADHEYADVAQGNALAPRIQVASISASLPDLTNVWATAHVQVDMNGKDEDEDPSQVIEDDPGRGFARIVALRKLLSDTYYTLFLVPTYRVGADAGLGIHPDASLGTALAWDIADTGPIDLPYYHRHRFKTEAGQDLEFLLRKLKGLDPDADGEAGKPLSVAIDNVGYYRTIANPGVNFEAQAALRKPGSDVPDYDTPLNLASAMSATLGSVLSEAEIDEEEDPLVTFPAHGMYPAGRTNVTPARAATGHWFDRLNLDLKFRAAAGLGREIVRRNDEHFADLCWDQYDHLMAANLMLRQLQVAEMLAGTLNKKHFSRMTPEASVQLGQPVLAYAQMDKDDPKAGSVQGLLEQKRVPAAFASLSLRRAISQKPVRMRKNAEGKPHKGRRAPLAAFPGDTTPTLDGLPRRDGLAVQRREKLSADTGRKELDDALRGLFNIELLGQKKRPRQPEPQVGKYESKQLQNLLGDKLVSLPKAKADALISGRSDREKEVGGPIYRSPRIDEPLIDYLRKFSQDSILSNVGALPDNTVSFYEENRHFVEALLAGANHAINEELRWRSYPTDMAGTIFPRFWNRGAPAFDRRKDDIIEMRKWTAKLGEIPNPADEDGKANVVVVIKGEVIRKLKDPIVEISIASEEQWSPESSRSYAPIYFGKIGKDTVYFGFDISREFLVSPGIRERAYLAIYEPPGRLRFGLDVSTQTIRRQRPNTPDLVLQSARPPLRSWDDMSWAHMQLTGSDYVDVTKKLEKPRREDEDLWGETKHAAGLARSFWQKPLAALLPLMRVL